MMSSMSNLKSIAEIQAVGAQQNNISIKKSNNDDSMNIISKDSLANSNKNESESSSVFKDAFKKISYKYDTKATEKAKANNKKKNIKNNKTEESDPEVEEKIKNLSSDDIMKLLSMLSQLLDNTNNDTNINLEEVKNFSDLFKTDISELFNNANNIANDSLIKPNDIFNNLLSALESVNEKEEISSADLKLIQQLVNEAAEKLNKNDSESTKLLGTIQDKLNEMISSIDKKSEELSLENSSLNNIYKNIATEDNSSSDSSTSNKDGEASQSKDEKVLNSILNDNKTSAPVFNTNTMVNNNTNMVTEAKETVNAQNMARDIVQNVRYMSSNDVREMVVKVNPGNLGEITIRLVEEDGNMKLHMKAVSKETYSLLVQQSSDIKNQLSDQNIKIHDVNISLYEDDTTFFKGEEFSDSFNRQNENRKNSGTRNFIDNGITGEDEELQDDEYDFNSLNLLV